MALVVSAQAAEKRGLSAISQTSLSFFMSRGDVTIDEFLAQLRPAPLDPAVRAQVIAALPPDGAVRPGAGEIAKMELAQEVLANHGRRGLIALTLINVAPAFVGLHGRSVILVSLPVLPLLTSQEFAALVAHELGHEYFWEQYALATQRGDQKRIQEIELRCDGVAVLTLRRLGVSADRLVSALQKLSWYNERRKFTANRDHYASREERAAFIRAVEALSWREEPSQGPSGSAPVTPPR